MVAAREILRVNVMMLFKEKLVVTVSKMHMARDATLRVVGTPHAADTVVARQMVPVSALEITLAIPVEHVAQTCSEKAVKGCALMKSTATAMGVAETMESVFAIMDSPARNAKCARKMLLETHCAGHTVPEILHVMGMDDVV
jgi:hypothetical protein